jgi:hypothetical protein
MLDGGDDGSGDSADVHKIPEIPGYRDWETERLGD